MSVPEGKRTESKLEVQTKAKELAVYTVTICGNEKVFPKRDRWAISKENINKRKRKLRKHRNLVLSGKMSKEKADACFESWKAHARNGNSHKLIENMDKFYDDLWRCDDVQKIDA